MFAKRLKSIHSSGIRKVFDLAAKQKNIINLSIGQPDFNPPKEIKKSIINAARKNKFRYTQTQGIDELRTEILQNLKLEKYKTKSVMITPGVSAGIFLAYSTLLDKRDELIVFDPYFVVYPDVCEFLGAKPRFVKLNDDFTINIERLRNAINKKTKAIIINSPNNPTGHVMSKKEVKELVKIAKENDLWILSDEIYKDFIYKGKFTSPARFYEKTIVLNGFSKNYALPGLRLGYVAGPDYVIDKLTQLQQYTYVCAPSIGQYGLVGNTNIKVNEIVNEYKERAELVYEGLKDNFKIAKPEGGFYAFPKVPNMKGTKFVEKCIKAGVLVIPGNVFSKTDTHFRISFTTSKKNLKRGIKIINSLVEY